MKKLVLVMFVLVVAFTRAQATIVTNAISIDWGVNAGNVLQPTEAGGVVTVTNWNGFTDVANHLNLTNNHGIATTADLTIHNLNGLAAVNSTAGLNGRMLNGVIYNNGFPAAGFNNVLTISAIPYERYDVYVYLDNNATGRTADFRIGTDVQQFLDTQTTGTIFTRGENYLLFTGVTGTGFTLEADTTYAGNQILLSGLQIVAVPEPSTIFLLGTGGLAIWHHARRRKK